MLSMKKARECLREFLNIKASIENKRSQCCKSDILCVLAGTKNEERQFSNIVIKDEGSVRIINP